MTTDHWEFLWDCPTCRRKTGFMVTEIDGPRTHATKRTLPHRVWGRCRHCTRLLEVGDEQRELRMK